MTEPENTERRLNAGLIVVILVIIGFLVSGAGLYWLVTTRSAEFGSRISVPTTKGPASAGGVDEARIERPEPTPAQTAAIAGGQTASWASHGLAWTVPAGWQRQTDTAEQFVWRSPDDAATLSVTATPMPEALATTGLAAIYDEALDQQRQGAYSEVRLLEIGGVRGVQFRDAAERVHWHAYYTAGGATRLVNVVVHSTPEGVARSADALYGVLYSMEVSP